MKVVELQTNQVRRGLWQKKVKNQTNNMYLVMCCDTHANVGIRYSGGCSTR